MSLLADFNFTNSNIKKFFDGDDSYMPITELMYLHEHPLIKSSFLTEIEKKILECSEYLSAKNMQGIVVDQFVQSTIKIGTALPTLSQQTAPIVLKELRSVYKLCNRLLNQANR